MMSIPPYQLPDRAALFQIGTVGKVDRVRMHPGPDASQEGMARFPFAHHREQVDLGPGRRLRPCQFENDLLRPAEGRGCNDVQYLHEHPQEHPAGCVTADANTTIGASRGPAMRLHP